MQNERLIHCVMGPTASGKSRFAIELAHQIRGEIVSADAMQVYCHLDIGTAKVLPHEREGIAHHLIDICQIGERFDVNEFIERAQHEIEAIFDRGNTPIICGGTGYYIKALLYGLDQTPGDDVLRKELDQKYDHQEGEAMLHEQLKRADPRAYEVYRLNRRKLIRALEVFLLTGKSILDFYSETKSLRFPVKSIWLNPSVAYLRERIFSRVKIMLESGWIEETKRAEALGFFSSPTAHQSIGYSLINQYLKNEISYAKMVDLIGIRTCQYARRQRAWFRHQHPESVPLDPFVCSSK